MKKPSLPFLLKLISLLCFITVLAQGALALKEGMRLDAASFEHERLKLHNTLKTPEEVVQYYCARDASGFVWSGLLDSERREFTLWKEVPQQDSFYVAKSYEVLPVKPSSRNPSHATVEVRYELMGIGDAQGTLMPVKDPHLSVVFDLEKIGKQWKIISPAPPQISAVVLQSKFPFPVVTAQN